MIHVRIAVMSNSGFSVGDRVTRVDDGAVGVIVTIAPGDDVGVRWEPSGVIQSIVPLLLKPAEEAGAIGERRASRSSHRRTAAEPF